MNNNINAKTFYSYIKNEVIDLIVNGHCTELEDLFENYEDYFDVGYISAIKPIFEKYAFEITMYAFKAQNEGGMKIVDLNTLYSNAIYYVLNDELDVFELWAEYVENEDYDDYED